MHYEPWNSQSRAKRWKIRSPGGFPLDCWPEPAFLPEISRPKKVLGGPCLCSRKGKQCGLQRLSLKRHLITCAGPTLFCGVETVFVAVRVSCVAAPMNIRCPRCYSNAEGADLKLHRTDVYSTRRGSLRHSGRN